MEAVHCVEDGAVRIGKLGGERQDVRRDLRGAVHGAEALEELDRAAGPDGPLSEEPADDPALARLAVGSTKPEGRHEIEDDLIVVPGVERDVLASRRDDRPHDVERPVAIEAGDLDRDDVLDLGEAAPKGVRQLAPADRRLEIEAEDRDDLGDRAHVSEDRVLIRLIAEGPEAEKPGVVTELAKDLRLGDGAPGAADDAADANEGLGALEVGAVHLLLRELEHRAEEPVARVADRELRRVDADGEAARARIDVVARERPLPPLIECSLARERERMRGKNDSARENRPDSRIETRGHGRAPPLERDYPPLA